MEPGALQRPRDRPALIACDSGDENRSMLIVPPCCIVFANIAIDGVVKAFVVCPLAVRLRWNVRHSEPLATPRTAGVCCP
jgi:hypothetical protein